MDYFAAVQEGRARVRRAVEILQSAAGPSSPVLFLKLDSKEWTPVGEENLVALVWGKNATAALTLCDSDGNSKAISGWLDGAKAAGLAKELEKEGIPAFSGEVRLPL